MLDEGLGSEEGAFQIDVQDKVIVRFRNFPERSVFLYPGVIDPDI
jgi:hypothetical protein